MSLYRLKSFSIRRFLFFHSKLKKGRNLGPGLSLCDLSFYIDTYLNTAIREKIAIYISVMDAPGGVPK